MKNHPLIDKIQNTDSLKGKIIVVKYGGNAMINNDLKLKVMQDITFMKNEGIKPVVVHGGGPEINKLLNRVNKKSEFVEGLRKTDEETMEIVEMALAGKVNKEVVTNLQLQGGNAVGISGKDGNLLTVNKKLINGKDAGFIGEVNSVNPNIIYTLLDNEYIPVIAPTAKDINGNSYNVNADYAASAIAGALQAEKLLFLTDIKGVLKNIKDPKSLIPQMSINEAEKLIKTGIISGGMIPKVDCCIEGVKNGVKSVHIIDGRVEHSLLLELCTNNNTGTRIFKDSTI